MITRPKMSRNEWELTEGGALRKARTSYRFSNPRYVDAGAVKDYVVLQGVGNFPGGLKHMPPKACGVGEWDYTGGHSGAGGGADVVRVNRGKNGAVKILRPGFYFEDSSLLQALG